MDTPCKVHLEVNRRILQYLTSTCELGIIYQRGEHKYCNYYMMLTRLETTTNQNQLLEISFRLVMDGHSLMF
jgi:hypothetical protein